MYVLPIIVQWFRMKKDANEADKFLILASSFGVMYSRPLSLLDLTLWEDGSQDPEWVALL